MRRALAVLLVLLLFACAANPRSAVSPTAGNIVGASYSHEELGVEVELPPGWLFFPPSQLQEVLSRSFDSGPGSNAIVPLFGMYSVAGANPAFSNNVIAMLEIVSSDVVGLTSMTYAISLRKYLNIEAGYDAARLEPQKIALGGQSVAAVNFSTEEEGTEYKQIFYAHVIDEAVLLIIGTESPAVPSDLADALEAIRLRR